MSLGEIRIEGAQSTVSLEVDARETETETETLVSDTFKNTAVGLFDDDDIQLDPVERTKYLKLPNGYDVVAVRETLLSEAPFVSRGNKAFWRRMMDNSQFVDILKCSYHHIMACISDSGVVHEEMLVDIHSSPLIEAISNNFADIYFGVSRHERDLYIPKLPELLCFMTINALQAAAPKHQRLYMSTRFREILIDWGVEIFGGVRQSHNKVGKEWIFADCSDNNVMTTSKPSKFTAAMETQKKRAKSQYPLNTIGSSYVLDHSPLIKMYIERNNKSCHLIKNKLNVTLSHFPDRPLTTLQPGLLKSVRFRERKTDTKEIKQTIKRSNTSRRAILTELDVSEAGYKRDMHRMREALKTKLRVLNNVKVSRKQEYEMKAAELGGRSISSGGF